ncbi:MAG: hypothetical protein J5911_02080 [Clostridia bacterium]|nr:hypothetical protein [Clostridia bacterium]
MFGYLTTDFPNLYVKDTVLYKSAYCGLCKSIGRICGTKGRFLLNYDLTFLSVFTHNVVGCDFEIKKQRCILHFIVKRPIAVPDGLSQRIAALNVILAYYKLTDNVLDEGNGRLKRSFFKQAYKKAKKVEPTLDAIVKSRYDELMGYERQNSDSIDAVADPFGAMMKDIVRELVADKFTENIGELSYNIGKWIYLIDALDDFDKDKKNGAFNVFVNSYNNFDDKRAFVDAKKQDLQFIFGGILSIIYENAVKIAYNFNHDLTDNILLKGVFEQTKNIMECKKCKNSIKY